MGKYKKLGKNVALLTIGNFASKLLSFLLVPFYTAALSTSEYGTADMITTSVNLVMPVFTLLVYESVMRYSLDIANDRKQVFSIGLYVTIIGGILITLGSQILKLSNTLRPYILLFILYYISLAVYNLILQFVKGIEQVAVYSTAGVVNTFIFITSNIIFLLFCNLGVSGYLMAFVIGHTAAALYAFLKAGVYRYVIGYSKLQFDIFLKMLRYSIPMIPNSISWWISNSSDKYILTFFWGVSINGIYSVAYKIPSILTIAINIFISAWQISAVENFGSKESSEFYADIYDKYESLLFIGSAVLIGGVQILARYLFSNDFYAAWLYTPVLICASMFNSLAAFYGSVYTSAKRTSMLFYSTLAGATVNIVLNILMIPSMGAMGAAIATMISYIVVWGVRAINSRHIFKFNIKIKRDIVAYAVLMVEVVLICLERNPFYIVSLISVLVICILCAAFIKDMMQLVFNTFGKSLHGIIRGDK